MNTWTLSETLNPPAKKKKNNNNKLTTLGPLPAGTYSLKQRHEHTFHAEPRQT